MSPRADAARNRERVLAAAEAVFAAKGTSASTEEIAREAGVGIGTVFRHFPTKEALLSAVLSARLEAMADQADALAEADDPAEALFVFIRRAVEQARTKNAYTAALAAAGIDARNLATDAKPRVRDAVQRLLTSAHKAGAIRPDIGVDELFALLVGASHIAEYTEWNAEVLDRTLAVLFDGLRPR